MAAAKKYIYQETWNTRYGKSQRVVVRENGRFVDNKSKKQIKNREYLSYTRG